MKFSKDDMESSKKFDLDNLDAIIKRCEAAMVSPWKKKDAKPDDAVEVLQASDSDDDERKPGLEDMDMDDLMRMYEELKDRK